MHSAVQTAAVTIISYKALSDLNFARYTQHYRQLHALFSFGVYKPLILLFDVSSHTASEKVPLLLAQGPSSPSSSSSIVIGDAPKLIGADTSSTSEAVARPESLILDKPLVPLRLVSLAVY